METGIFSELKDACFFELFSIKDSRIKNNMNVLSIIILLFLTLNVLGQDKKMLAPSPWNSWNWFGKKEIKEQNMKECIDDIVQEGLLDFLLRKRNLILPYGASCLQL